MSVGKMNQLFGNEGFLKPEKRCLKGPACYRYRMPVKCKVISKYDGGLFSYLSPSVKEVDVDQPRHISNYYLAYQKPEFLETYSYDLSKSIRSAQDVIDFSKKTRIFNSKKQAREIEKCTNRALSSLNRDIHTISQLNQEMERLKSELINFT